MDVEIEVGIEERAQRAFDRRLASGCPVVGVQRVQAPRAGNDSAAREHLVEQGAYTGQLRREGATCTIAEVSRGAPLTHPNERVMYVPPKSMGFGHAARARNAREAWKKTLGFLERNALYELCERSSFVCPRSGEGLGEAVRNEYLNYVRSALGPEGGEPGYPSWLPRRDQFEGCVELALNEDRWPRQRYGPAHFHFCYDFVWRREGATRIARDHAPNEVPKYSWLGISIGSGKVFLQPRFFFPFPFESGELPSMLRTISADLPFKFSPHHFQRVFPFKEGRCYNSRRLSSGWLQSNDEP